MDGAVTQIDGSEYAATLRGFGHGWQGQHWSTNSVSGGGETTDRCAFDPKPDGPRYAAMGDAVTVNVAEWIGRRLRDA